MDKTDEKINNFINLLIERTIDQIDNTDIKESCTATLLLIFAAIDSLSKITSDDKVYKQGSGARFKSFLENNLENKYSVIKDEIYDLRNDVVHTGIATKVVLSKNQDNTKHLEKVNGYLWINTNQFLDDFKVALEKIIAEIQKKDTFFQKAMSRLNEFNIIKLDEEQDMPVPTPGPDENLFN